MSFKDMLKSAFSIGSESKYNVLIGVETIKEMSYIELGAYLVSNVSNIELVVIELKE